MFGWGFYDEVFLMTNFFFVKNNPKECFIAEDLFLYKRIIQTVPLGQIGSWESAFKYHVVVFFLRPSEIIVSIFFHFCSYHKDLFLVKKRFVLSRAFIKSPWWIFFFKFLCVKENLLPIFNQKSQSSSLFNVATDVGSRTHYQDLFSLFFSLQILFFILKTFGVQFLQVRVHIFHFYRDCKLTLIWQLKNMCIFNIQKNALSLS